MKTNRLAIVSFVSGILTIFSIGLIFLLHNSQVSTGTAIGVADGILMPIRNLCVAIALISGILALSEMKKKEGTDKGRILAWIGIIFASAWIIFGFGVGVSFLVAEILN